HEHDPFTTYLSEPGHDHVAGAKRRHDLMRVEGAGVQSERSAVRRVAALPVSEPVEVEDGVTCLRKRTNIRVRFRLKPEVPIVVIVPRAVKQNLDGLILDGSTRAEIPDLRLIGRAAVGKRDGKRHSLASHGMTSSSTIPVVLVLRPRVACE